MYFFPRSPWMVQDKFQAPPLTLGLRCLGCVCGLWRLLAKQEHTLVSCLLCYTAELILHVQRLA